MTAKKHHFISQCYLRGFTINGDKKSKLVGISVRDSTYFGCHTEDVGVVKHFNTINIPGLAPDWVESRLSSFESDVAIALKELADKQSFDGAIKEILLNFIAMIAIRHPSARASREATFQRIAEISMGIVLASEHSFMTHMKRMSDSGESLPDVSYSRVKSFYDSKKYAFDVPRERHISSEMKLWDVVLELLKKRNWALLCTDGNTKPFITSDNPVSLSWINDDDMLFPPRSSFGFGSRGTEVFFPVSKSLGLVGTFEGRQGVYQVSEKLVAIINTLALRNARHHIFAPSLAFKLLWSGEQIIEGGEYINANGVSL